MADGSSYRSSRAGALPPRRDEPSADAARHTVIDPLAELARLIGQDEAFGAIARDSARQEPRVEPPRKAEEPAPPQSHSESDRDDIHSPHGAAADDPDPRPPGSRDTPEHEAPYDAPAYDIRANDAHPHQTAEAYHSRPDETAEQPHDQYAAGDYYDDDAHYDEEHDYVDRPPARWRGLGIVAAVIGLALVGSAGAFGYWVWSGGSGGNGEPPPIKADTTPDKAVPPTQGGGSPWDERIYGRFGEKSSNGAERVVPPEETLAEVKPAVPRQIFPAGSVYGPAPSQTAAPAQQPTGVPDSAEPRKARTETIRPNQVASVDPGQTAKRPLAAPASAAPVAPAKQSAARSKQGTAGPAPVVVGAQSPAAEPSAAPPPARGAAPAGRYVVQLSSQRSEEEAQASFRALQTKYPNVFGNRQPVIRRTDLGDKGVSYRTEVGPFANVEQANQFCSNLKIVGGQCIVQKN